MSDPEPKFKVGDVVLNSRNGKRGIVLSIDVTSWSEFVYETQFGVHILYRIDNIPEKYLSPESAIDKLGKLA